MFTLISTTPVSDQHYLLTLHTDVLSSVPGQFVNIKVNANTDPLIRRPFSIFDHDGSILKIVVRVVGKGTSQIVSHPLGIIDCIGPFGNGFTTVEHKKVLCIGGGVGNAPLFYLAKKLYAHENTVTFLYGARSKKDIFLYDSFCKVTHECIAITDDGSFGIKGNPVDVAKDMMNTSTFDMIYTCGPEVMMKRLSQELSHTHIEASLERYFGCGVGLCAGCAVATKDEYKRACLEGPVFDAHTVAWDKK